MSRRKRQRARAVGKTRRVCGHQHRPPHPTARQRRIDEGDENKRLFRWRQPTDGPLTRPSAARSSLASASAAGCSRIAGAISHHFTGHTSALLNAAQRSLLSLRRAAFYTSSANSPPRPFSNHRRRRRECVRERARLSAVARSGKPFCGFFFFGNAAQQKGGARAPGPRPIARPIGPGEARPRRNKRGRVSATHQSTLVQSCRKASHLRVG